MMPVVKSSFASQSERQLASAVQKALLTGEIPQCHCGKMVVRNRMYDGVGGDFYHFRELGQDQIAFAMGDVAGHGISAALVMTLILGLLRADRQDNRRPERVVAGINDMLVHLGEQVDMAITCSLIYAVVDLPSGIVLYINAGHPNPIICNCQTGQTHHLVPTTMLLGVQGGVREESCHQFRQQDRLVLFTDGISEARNPAKEIFGERRLQTLVKKSYELSADGLAEDIFKVLEEFRNGADFDDDQTLVVIDFEKVSTE